MMRHFKQMKQGTTTTVSAWITMPGMLDMAVRSRHGFTPRDKRGRFIPLPGIQERIGNFRFGSIFSFLSAATGAQKRTVADSRNDASGRLM
jgi:hypothetical protein